MPASVPTAEEFAELADRVAALEARDPDVEPEPEPGPDPEPEPTATHTVVAGDTLSSIAARFGVSVEELVEWNSIAEPDRIVVGDVLFVAEPEQPEPEPEPEPGAVPAPTGLTAVADQDRRVIVLNWDPVPGAQSYTIYEDTSGIGRAGFPGITDTTDVDRGPMGDDREYVWTVTAVRGGKESARSNVAKATIGDDDPDPKPNPGPGPKPEPGRGLVAAVAFDGSGDDPFEGFNRGDRGIRQWSDDGPNTFALVEYQGQTYGRARITGGPHGNDIRAEGIVVALGTDSTLKLRRGDEYWFGDTIVIGEGFPARHFNNVLQWKNDGTGSAPMYFGAWDDGMQLRSSFGNRDVGAIDFGRPHRYVFGVLFDSDGDGWVEVWRDGEQTLDRTAASTLHSGKDSYPKVGYYRGDEIVGDGSVYHRDYRIGRTRESVS